jgi:hypothetical protein
MSAGCHGMAGREGFIKYTAKERIPVFTTPVITIL